MRFTTFASWLGRSIAWHLGGAIVHHAPAITAAVALLGLALWARHLLRRLRRNLRYYSDRGRR